MNGIYVTDTLLRQLNYSFQGKNISRAFVDKSGNEWLCSLSGEGVYMRLKNEVKQYDITSGLLNDNVTSVKMTLNNLLICGDGNGHVYTIDPAKNNIRPSVLEKFPEAIRGIELFNKSIIAYSSYKLMVNEKVLPDHVGAIKSAIPDSNGNLLIGSHQKLELYDISSGQTEIIKGDPRFVTLCYSQGDLYYGNNKGLFKIESIKPYVEVPIKDSLNVLSKPINHLASTPDGILWVATNNDGVLALRNDKILGHFTISSRSSLTSNICKKIFVDEKKGLIWTATNKGVNRIRYSLSARSLSATITAITSSEGLNDDDVNDICVKNGKVYAATIKGICVFNTDLIKTEVPVVITDIFIKNYSSPDTSNFLKPDYVLNYTQNNISINFAGICYTCNKKIDYQYRLINNDDDTSWKTINANTVEFVGLQPGDYTFQVHTDSANVKEIRFHIRKAFWQTNFFYFLIALSIAALFILSVKYIVHQVKKRELEKTAVNKKFAELEFQALQAQMNPHFLFNSMNSLQNFILKNESENASEYLADFARLMRLFLEASREKYIELATEIELLEKYIILELVRLKHPFAYRIMVEPGIEMDKKIPSVIIQPFIENAILHGLRYRDDNNGLLNILFTMKGSVLQCQIEDNGIGRSEAEKINAAKVAKYKSQGLKLIDEKIRTLKEANNVDIRILIKDNFNENGSPSGTTVTINFNQTA